MDEGRGTNNVRARVGKRQRQTKRETVLINTSPNFKIGTGVMVKPGSGSPLFHTVGLDVTNF